MCYTVSCVSDLRRFNGKAVSNTSTTGLTGSTTQFLDEPKHETISKNEQR
jgi:hypothetical protein